MSSRNLLLLSVVLLNGFQLRFSKTNDCPNTWTVYEEHCYLFTHVKLPFHEAENYCRNHDGHLVSIENSEENAFLQDHLRYMIGDEWWIGLTDDEVEGVWKWYGTGQKAEYFDWNPNQPDDGGSFPGGEDCGEFARGHWNGRGCPVQLNFKTRFGVSDNVIVG